MSPMTESKPSRAEAKRREKEWRDAYRRHEEQLKSLPGRDLDVLVANIVFHSPDLAALPFSTSWDGFGRIVEHMQQRGYTLLLNVFEPSHLKRINSTAFIISRRDSYQAAEVTVVDIHRRLSLPETWPNLRLCADTLPRALAIAAVLVDQMERGLGAPSPEQPELPAATASWGEERRRQQSERMKSYWQRKRAAAHAGEGADRP